MTIFPARPDRPGGGTALAVKELFDTAELRTTPRRGTGAHGHDARVLAAGAALERELRAIAAPG